MKTITKETFGPKLVALRRKARMDQMQLAAKLEVGQSTVSRWEKGVSLPDPAYIDRICAAFNVSEEFFEVELDGQQYVDFPRLEKTVEAALQAMSKSSKTWSMDSARKAAGGDLMRELLVTLAALDDSQIARYLAMIRAELDASSGASLKPLQKKSDNSR